MAVTWDIEITNVDVASKRGNVAAVRTDDSDPLNPQTYTFTSVVLETSQQRSDLLNLIRAKVLEREGKDTAISVFIDNLEASGETALNTWEAGR